MGKLVEGKWHDVWYDTESRDGRFVRQDSAFRNWITPDGSPGPSGAGGFPAEPGRYHLYVSLACPWAHRTMIMRRLKGLEEMISVSVVNAHMGAEGWTFDPGPGVVPDNGQSGERLHEVYTLRGPELHRPGDGAGVMGQAARDDRVERVRGDPAHVQQRVRRRRRETRRLLPGGSAHRDRRS